MFVILSLYVHILLTQASLVPSAGHQDVELTSMSPAASAGAVSGRHHSGVLCAWKSITLLHFLFHFVPSCHLSFSEDFLILYCHISSFFTFISKTGSFLLFCCLTNCLFNRIHMEVTCFFFILFSYQLLILSVILLST